MLKEKLIWGLLFLAICSSPLHALARSCEKNGTCKKRFEIQSDPYDIERESSRSHVIIFYSANFLLNRGLETDFAKHTLGFRELTKTQRILISAATLTAFGILKDLIYDPDGLSRSDATNNEIGIALGVALEFSL